MRGFLGRSLGNFARLIVLVCLVGGWSLFNSLLGLRDTIEDIATTDREQTLWTATQIEFVLSEFRSDLISSVYAEGGPTLAEVSTKFDIVYSRVSQVQEAQIQLIIAQHGGANLAERLILLRDEMASLIDQEGGASPADLLEIYRLASQAQTLWHPYKFVMLEAARNDRAAKLDGVADALSNVRIHLIFGLVAAIGAGLAVMVSYFMARNNSVLVQKLSKDEMTGCYSRQGFENVVSGYFQDGRTISVAVVDIDNLKEVNDTLGHAEGDLHIKRVGQAIRDVFRKEDCIARVGGDEFWIAADAPTEMVLEKLRQVDAEVQSYTWSGRLPSGRSGISFGAMSVSRYEDVEQAVQAADQSMYGAKRLRKVSRAG